MNAVVVPSRPSELIRLVLSLLPAVADGPIRLGDLLEQHLRDTNVDPAELTRKVLAINAMQRGRIRQAFAYLRLPYLSVEDWIDVMPYHFSAERFVVDMQQMAHALEIRGH